MYLFPATASLSARVASSITNTPLHLVNHKIARVLSKLFMIGWINRPTQARANQIARGVLIALEVLIVYL